jgi:hypothetical protein
MTRGCSAESHNHEHEHKVAFQLFRRNKSIEHQEANVPPASNFNRFQPALLQVQNGEQISTKCTRGKG